MISERVQKMEVSGVRRMFELAAKVENPINLTIGQPDFDVPEEIKQEAIRAIKDGENKYTSNPGIIPLREKIQEKLKKRNKIHANIEEIIVTGAVSGGLSIILPTVLNPGDEVIIFDPYFVGYKQLVLQNQGKPVFVDVNEDFSLNLEKFEENITSKTKAVIVNTPNNPSGKVYSREELQGLAGIAQKYYLLVISDEVYEEFVYEQEHFSIGSIYDKTVTLNGFSKGYGMTGWRVGYLSGPADIVEEASKVQQFDYVCAPTPFQRASVKAFDVDMSEYVRNYKRKRDIIYDGLKKYYEIEKPLGAFYAFLKYPYDADKFIDDCLENNLLVVPGDVFSEKNEYFRISFVAPDEDLQNAAEIMKSFIN